MTAGMDFTSTPEAKERHGPGPSNMSPFVGPIPTRSLCPEARRHFSLLAGLAALPNAATMSEIPLPPTTTAVPPLPEASQPLPSGNTPNSFLQSVVGDKYVLRRNHLFVPAERASEV